MNSIFIRIYGGVLASLFLVGLLSYLVIARSNTAQTEAYREHLAKGTYYLVAQGAARYRYDERQQWLEKVENWIGESLKILPIVDSELEGRALEMVQRGQVYLKVLKKSRALDLYVKIPTEENLLINVKMHHFSEHQARGTAKLMIEELVQYPESDWNDELLRIQSHFGFPITRHNIEELLLDSQQQQRLAKGEVVVTFVGVSTERVSKIEIIAPLPIQQQAGANYLVLGPFDLYGDISYGVVFLIGALGLLALGVVTYSLVRPLQNRLKRMEKAVARVRKGDLSGRVVVDSGDALGQLAATFNDLVEHIQRLIDSQREMTRAVSHELRTPVARIRFGLEIVADLDDMEQRYRQIEKIDGDIEELNTLIDEILTYATLEEGTPSIKFEMVDVDMLLANIKRETEALGTSIKIEHKVSHEHGEFRFAECEERLIHRAVQNLVTNAIRYAESKVRVSCSYEGGMYRVDVEDDGAGIPQDKWEKVFVPFARLDDSRTRASGGYGLGLSIVKRIAYWHGGVASVYRSRWGGAKFTVIWPRMQESSRSASEERTHRVVEQKE